MSGVRVLGAVLPAFLVSRGLLAITALAAVRWLPPFPGDGVWPGSPNQPLLAALSRWDGKWYLAIARFGYGYHEGPASSMNFAPGYPGLIHLLGAATKAGNDTAALAAIGVVISNVALLLALGCLFALTTCIANAEVAGRAILWLTLVPSTFFLSAVYPQSLFLALSVGSFLLAVRGRNWALAAGLAAAAGIVRNYGVLLLVPLAWQYLEQHHWRLERDALWLGLIPIAFLAWQVYFWRLSGDPLAMAHASEEWGRRLTWPWEMLRYYLSPNYWMAFVRSRGASQDDRTVVDLVSTLVVGGLVVLSWRLRPRSLGVLATMLYVPMISTGGFIAIPRYGLEVFPAFVVLAQITCDRRILVPLAAVSAGLALVAMGWFAVGGWFT